jgi:tape measure domain-containing protein
MAENHELRLKIDAGAAKTGSREFVGAINAVKQAVRDLERDSSGVFTKLNKNMRDLSAAGKMKVGGVDKQSIRDLESFARAQSQIVQSSAASTKNIKTLISAIRGLSDSYAMARSTSDGFAASILKTNSGLMRQIQLASQARSAVRQIRTAPGAEAPVSASSGMRGKSEADSIARALQDVARAYAAAGAAGKKAGNDAAKAQMDAAKAVRETTKAAREAVAAQTRQEAVQLSAASATRRAEIDTARLVERLRQMGDTSGALNMSRALMTMKASLSGGVNSAHDLRKAIEGFAQAAAQARMAILGYDQAQARATAAAKQLAAAQREAATSARKVEQEMRSIAGANNAADAAFRRATGSMRGLENAFSGTFQAGSLFRTMLGSITFGSFVSSVFQAGSALEQFTVSMGVASGSSAKAMSELDYIDGLAGNLGVGLQTARDNYSKFAISASLAGVEASKTRHIFESVSTAMAVLGKGTEDQNLAFLALEQMMSKGKVSSEELRRQLGERLPGAVNLMAKALGVGIDQLQEMLKAGEINSADALPKFADEIMKAYGPGLEAATKRAGFSLGTLRNEILKFSETTANSGFMQELAIQFAKLTNALRSGGGQEAARKLGEGLARAAEIGGNAIMWMVENLDLLLGLLKGAAWGIAARQVTLFGAAFATGAQQMTGYIASLLAGTSAQAVADASTAKHTLSLNTNTASLAVNQGMMRRGVATTAAAAAAQELAVKAAFRHTAANTALAASGFTLRNAFTAAASGFAMATRALTVVAPVVGLIVAAVAILPSIFGETSDSVAKMASDIENATRRSGASFEEMGNSMQQSTSRINLNNIIRDIETLDGALANFQAGSFEKINQLGSVFRALEGTMSTFALGTSFDENALAELGIDPAVFDSMSAGAKQVSKDLVKMTAEAALGGGGFLKLKEAMAAAMLEAPGSAAVLKPIDDMITGLAEAELGVIKYKDRLVELFGTPDDQLTKSFADMATQVVATGEGMQGLEDRLAAAREETPWLVDGFEKIKKAALEAAATGKAPFMFAMEMQSSYDGVAQKIITQTKAAQDTANAAAESMAGFGNAVDTALMGMATSGATAAVIDQVRMMVEAYQGFEDKVLGVEQVQNVLNTLTFPTEAAREFSTVVMEQFAQLSAGEQTYDNLRRIMGEVASSSQFAGEGMDRFAQSMADSIRSGRVAGQTAEDLRSKVVALLQQLGLSDTAAGEYATAILNAADKNTELARNAAAAGSAVSGTVGAMYAAGNAGYAASAGVTALANAYGALAAAQGGLASAGGDIVKELKTRAEVAAIVDPTERRVAEFTRLGAGAKHIEKIDEEIQKATTALQGARGSSDDGARILEAAIGKRIAELNASKEGFSAQAAAAIRQEEVNKAAAAAANKAASGGGGSGGSSKEELTAMQKISESLSERLVELQEQKLALELVASGQYETAEAAQLMAEAMIASGGTVDAQTASMIKQIDAAAALNEQLESLAKDPVKEWMNSVPTWIEAGQQIEIGAIGHVKNALSEFIQTGKVDFESLGNAILGTVADIVADKAMAELANFLGRGEGNGLGGVLGNLFSSKGDPAVVGLGGGGDAAGVTAALNTGSTTAGTTISTAMINAGQTVSQQLASAMTQGGTTVQTAAQTGLATGATSVRTAATTGLAIGSNNIRTASTTGGTTLGQGVVTGAQQGAPILAAGVAGGAGGGGGGGGFLSGLGGVGGIFSMLLGAFSEGGMSTRPVGMASMPVSAFRNAPHFAEGTSNTSGIPAVLHPNEAVIPLSRGRKIPVDMGDAAGGTTNVVNQRFNITTPDADSFRRSQKQIAADAASAGSRAMRSNG